MELIFFNCIGPCSSSTVVVCHWLTWSICCLYVLLRSVLPFRFFTVSLFCWEFMFSWAFFVFCRKTIFRLGAFWSVPLVVFYCSFFVWICLSGYIFRHVFCRGFLVCFNASRVSCVYSFSSSNLPRSFVSVWEVIIFGTNCFASAWFSRSQFFSIRFFRMFLGFSILFLFCPEKFATAMVKVSCRCKIFLEQLSVIYSYLHFISQIMLSFLVKLQVSTTIRIFFVF